MYSICFIICYILYCISSYHVASYLKIIFTVYVMINFNLDKFKFNLKLKKVLLCTCKMQVLWPINPACDLLTI